MLVSWQFDISNFNQSLLTDKFGVSSFNKSGCQKIIYTFPFATRDSFIPRAESNSFLSTIVFSFVALLDFWTALRLRTWLSTNLPLFHLHSGKPNLILILNGFNLCHLLSALSSLALTNPIAHLYMQTIKYTCKLSWTR